MTVTRSAFSFNRSAPAVVVGATWLILTIASGCAAPRSGPVAFYLDGAGWYSSSGAVRNGLRAAGYDGQFHVFGWSAFLGPAHDHVVTARTGGVANRLASQIETVRRNDPDGRILVMGLSAGTAVILSALERLPEGVQVDVVALFSPSVSAKRDLTRAMRAVKGNLYATCSRRDGILGGLPVNADGKSGPPAGLRGFVMPPDSGASTVATYQRVVNLPWKPEHVGFGWNGGHTSVTSGRFVATVIAPRVLSDEPYPLDRSIAEQRPG